MGCNDKTFSFEAGRRCSSGQGLFDFRTSAAKALHAVARRKSLKWKLAESSQVHFRPPRSPLPYFTQEWQPLSVCLSLALYSCLISQSTVQRHPTDTPFEVGSEDQFEPMGKPNIYRNNNSLYTNIKQVDKLVEN